MSDKNPLEKAADILDSMTKFQKQNKLKMAYVEREEFKDSDLHEGFFCFNCIYWLDMSGGRCMIVNENGPDVYGRQSGIIAKHGCCNGYEPNFDKIRDTRVRTSENITSETA